MCYEVASILDEWGLPYEYRDATKVADGLKNMFHSPPSPTHKVACKVWDHKQAVVSVVWSLLWWQEMHLRLNCFPRKNLLTPKRNYNKKMPCSVGLQGQTWLEQWGNEGKSDRWTHGQGLDDLMEKPQHHRSSVLTVYSQIGRWVCCRHLNKEMRLLHTDKQGDKP